MTFPGLVRANNLSDVTDREKVWDNLGANIETDLSLYQSAGVDLANSLALPSKSNPNGNWSYGYTTTLGNTALTLVANSVSNGWEGPFSAGPFDGFPYFGAETSSETISSHTPTDAGQNASVIRWTSPVSGTIGIEAAFQRGSSSGDGMIPRIYKEGILLYDGGTLADTTIIASFDGIVSITAGEKIDFQVGQNGDAQFDQFSYLYLRIFTL